MKLDNTQKPTVAELFAGVGGFRLALENSGWSVSWSNQWEPATKAQHASSCYVANFGQENHSNEDIRLVLDKFENGVIDLPHVDMVVGGFPCQDYSVAKSLNASFGLEGKKGVLWWEIHRLVALRKPTYLLLENVDRLLKSPSKQRGRDFAVILKTLGDLGYRIEWRVINAADYGFPQRRIRTFIFASRNTSYDWTINLDSEYFLKGIFPSVFPAEYSNFRIFELEDNVEAISKTFNLGGAKSPFEAAGYYSNQMVLTAKPHVREQNHASRLGDILISDDDVPPEYWIEQDKIQDWVFLKGAKKLERVTASGFRYSYAEGKMSFPDDLSKPSRTILTGEGGSSPSRFKHVINTRRGMRRLVPRELERLNGFPDDWTRFDSLGNEISDTRRAFFMGNALVVGLVEMIGKEIFVRFFGK